MPFSASIDVSWLNWFAARHQCQHGFPSRSGGRALCCGGRHAKLKAQSKSDTNGSSSMDIFITGASGFVGGAFAKAVAGRHTLTAMSRSEKSDAKIAASGATPVRCTLDDVTVAQLKGAGCGCALRGLCRGVGAVVGVLAHQCRGHEAHARGGEG